MSGLSINTRQQQQDYHDDYDGQGQDLQGGGGGGNGNGQQQDSSFDDDDDDGMSSSPSIPDENIDFDLVYALHTFVATVEGQASVVKGDALTLLDDSNSYWWLVKVLKTTEVGYIPAENIETPYERLARLNKHRNVELTSQQNNQDVINRPLPRSIKKKKVFISKGVSFQSQVIITAETEEEDDEEEYEEWEEEMADDDDEDMDEDPRAVASVAQQLQQQMRSVQQQQGQGQARRNMDPLANGAEPMKLSLTPQVARDDDYDMDDDGMEDDEDGEGHRGGSKAEKMLGVGGSVVQRKQMDVDKDLAHLDGRKDQWKENQKKGGLRKFFSRGGGKKEKEEVAGPGGKSGKPGQKRTGPRPVASSPSSQQHLGSGADNDSADTASFNSVESGGSFDSVRGGSREYDGEPAHEREREPRTSEENKTQLTVLRVFAGNVNLGPTFKTVMVNPSTTAAELVRQAILRFHIQEIEGGAGGESNSGVEYYVTVKGVDGEEYTLAPQDHPLSIFETLTAHLNTPMPSVTAIKRISQNYNSNTVELTRVGVSGLTAPISPTAGHFGEDSVIKFFLHKKIKRVDEREGKIYIKVSLFSDDVVNGFGAAANPRASLSAKNLQKKKKQEASSERIDKLIAVRPHTPIADVTALALDKFHLLNGVVDGDEDMERRRKAMGEKDQRLVSYTLKVAVGNGPERALNQNETIISAFQGPTPPIKSSRNSGSDIASVTSGSSTASAPHADETYFVLRRTDKHKDLEYAKQQAAQQALPKRQDSSSSEKDLKRAISPPLGTTISPPLGTSSRTQYQPQRGSTPPAIRPAPTRKDTAGFHEPASLDENAVNLDGRPMRRSQILRMLDVDDTVSVDSDRTVSPPPTSLRSAKRFSPDKVDRHLSNDEQPRQGDSDDLPEVAVPRRPAEEVLSKLDEALYGLEYEKQEHAALLEAKLNDFRNSGSSGTMRTSPTSGPPKQLTPQQMRHQRMMQEQERAESPLLLQGSINALRNEEDGVDIVLPGKVGMLRSSRMFDSKVRYSFVAPDGSEKEISTIIEDILGDMGASSDLLEEDNVGDLASTLSGPPPTSTSSSSPQSSVDVLPVAKKDKKDSKKSKGLGKKKKTDILESYVDQATGSSMRIETLERLEKVLKRVKDGDKKEKKKDTKKDKEDSKKPSSKVTKSSSKIPAKAPSLDQISSSPEPLTLLHHGSLDSIGASTRVDSPPTSVSDLRKAALGRNDSPISMSTPTPTRRSPADSPSLGFDRSSSSTPTSGITESTKAPRSHNAHDSMVFSDDFGLDELMVLVRGGITFLEAKEKKKDGWEDENGNPIPQNGASPTPQSGREGKESREVKDKEKESVEVRQDIKEVFRESLSNLDDLEKELERIMSDTVKAF